MKYLAIAFILGYSVSFVSASIFFKSRSMVSPRIKSKVLAFSSDQTEVSSQTYAVEKDQQEEAATETPKPTSTPEPTNTPIPTSTPTPVPPTPTATPIPQPEYSSEQIHGFVERFAGQYGVNPNVLRHVAICESGFNHLAVNGPYAGLFQFSANTWINNRTAMGEDPDPALRYNPEEAAQTAAYMISIGKIGAFPNCTP